MSKNTYILAINDGHDSSIALLRNGRFIFAIEEERLRNIKHFSGVPTQSLYFLFNYIPIKPEDIDLIAVVSLVRTYNPSDVQVPFFVRIYSRFAKLIQLRPVHKITNKILRRLRKQKDLLNILKQLNLLEKPIVFIEHHQAHAASAYRNNPWDENEKVLIFTADAAGDGLSATVSIGYKNRINRIAESNFFNSLGRFYTETTGYLGLKRDNDEYKLMGLAPYGNYNYSINQIRNIIQMNDNNPLEFKNRTNHWMYSMAQHLQKRLKEHRFDNVAAATQKHFEDLMIKWITNAIKKTNIHKIAMSGGVFLNVKANKKIRELEEVKEMFVYPAAGDGGTAIGAGLEAYFQYCKIKNLNYKRFPLKQIYYGPEYDNILIEKYLEKYKTKYDYERIDKMEEYLAEYIVKGKIVARFSERMEWGPRALGNRSIVADPRDIKVTKKINEMIKHRTWWMPFAPTILKERAEDYLVNPVKAPYMIDAFDTTSKREEIKAAIHPYDETCRPQILEKDWNPSYYRIISRFQDITGVGAVLNTSFNLHGYPIVCSPRNALWVLNNSKLDGVAIGNFMITKK